MTITQVEFPWWQTQEIRKRPKQTNYKKFVEKFSAVKTTDDCYTPQAVFDAVVEFVEGFYPLQGFKILRPFKPNGDYLAEDYNGAVVVDNPPFSMYSQIVRNYTEMGVQFFLFAPALTTFVLGAQNVCYVITSCKIKYENGAVVNTNFITNMMPSGILISAKLRHKIEDAQHIKRKAPQKREYPPTLVTSARLCKYARMGMDKFINFNEYVTKFQGEKFFGYGVKISEQDANELMFHELKENKDE